MDSLTETIRCILFALRKWVRETYEEIQDYEASRRTKNEGQRQKELPPDKPVEVRAVVSYDDKTVGDNKAEANRQHRTQNSIKRAAWSAFIAACVYATIAAYQAYEMHRSTLAAQKSADSAAAQLQVTDRPWVKATPKKVSPITFDAEGRMTLAVNFDLTNVGHSVATGVTIYSGAFAQESGSIRYFEDPPKRQKELCGKPQEGGVVLTLFPEETKELGIRIYISHEEMAKNIVPPPPGAPNPPIPAGDRISPILFGCVDYRYGGLAKHHQTGFIYSVGRLESDGPIPHLVIIGRDVPGNQVSLNPWAFGGDEAN